MHICLWFPWKNKHTHTHKKKKQKKRWKQTTKSALMLLCWVHKQWTLNDAVFGFLISYLHSDEPCQYHSFSGVRTCWKLWPRSLVVLLFHRGPLLVLILLSLAPRSCFSWSVPCCRAILSQVNSPVVFCHNDLQEGGKYNDVNYISTAATAIATAYYCHYCHNETTNKHQ